MILAFSCKDSQPSAGPLAPTLRSMNYAASHLNGGGQVALFIPGPPESLRRATPTECERLQGLLACWTALYADSWRYRFVGDAVAVPLLAWVGSGL